ncbi:uncharacterized protein LOC142343274 [Convolutriloba macropyga]|uniref:uncharacterized protein LOC142343274 n=1 Tax=Convolutriloba macropyga TaxID=536237 RepID=UPI003F51CBB7
MASDKVDRFIRRQDATKQAQILASQPLIPSPSNTRRTSTKSNSSKPVSRRNSQKDIQAADVEKELAAASAKLPKFDSEKVDKSHKFHFLYYRTFSPPPQGQRDHETIDGSRGGGFDLDEYRSRQVPKERQAEWYCSSFSAALTLAANSEQLRQLTRPKTSKPNISTTRIQSNSRQTSRPNTVPNLTQPFYTNDILSRLMAVDTTTIQKEATIRMLGNFEERVKTPPTPVLPDPFKPKSRLSVEFQKSRRKSRRSTIIKLIK